MTGAIYSYYTNFIYPSAGKGGAVAGRSSGTAVDPPAVVPDHGDRACCCPAKAVVQVAMPTVTRPHASDLLLCGHHYRFPRAALAAAHAVVHDLPGVPGDTAAWIYDDHDRSLAPAKCAN